LAACLLAERFALPKCTGIQQLCTEISSFRTADCSHQALSFSSTASETIPQDLASSLVAIVDQASSSSDSLQRSLSPEAFIPHITGQFILAITTSNVHDTHSQTVSLSKTSSGQHAGPDNFDGQDTQHQLAFMAEVIGRLCRRGHVGAVAKALWGHILAVQESKGKKQHQQQQAQQSRAKLDDDAQKQSLQPSQQLSQQQPHQHQAQLLDLQQLPEPQQLLHQQQQQQQQQQTSQQDQGCQTTPVDAPAAALSQPLASAQQAVCCVVAAMQDPAALDKLLTALLQQTDAVGDANDSSLEMLQCIVRPLWARGTVRQALSTVYCLLSTVYCLLSTVYCLLSVVYYLLSTSLSLFTLHHLLSTEEETIKKDYAFWQC